MKIIHFRSDFATAVKHTFDEFIQNGKQVYIATPMKHGIPSGIVIVGGDFNDILKLGESVNQFETETSPITLLAKPKLDTEEGWERYE